MNIPASFPPWVHKSVEELDKLGMLGCFGCIITETDLVDARRMAKPTNGNKNIKKNTLLSRALMTCVERRALCSYFVPGPEFKHDLQTVDEPFKRLEFKTHCKSTNPANTWNALKQPAEAYVTFQRINFEIEDLEQAIETHGLESLLGVELTFFMSSFVMADKDEDGKPIHREVIRRRHAP